MNTRLLCRGAAFAAVLALLPAAASATGKMIQLGTTTALEAGVYDGAPDTMNVLQRPQAYGLGVFDKFDGDMIVIEGVAYRFDTEGKATKPVSAVPIPYAQISVLDTPDVAADIGACANLADLEKFILSHLDTVNYPVLVVVDGRFEGIKAASFPAQRKPYAPFAEISSQEKRFDLGAMEGTLVGFYCPDWMAGIAPKGFRFAFINTSHEIGGAVRDLALKDGKLRAQYLTGFQVILQGTDSAYAQTDLEPAPAKAFPLKAPSVSGK